jgi:type IV secretory pathway TrbD component
MSLKRTPIHRSGTRPHLFLGGDRELVLFFGMISGVLIWSCFRPVTIIAGIIIWTTSLWILRRIAKADPLMRHIYARQLLYRRYYPSAQHSISQEQAATSECLLIMILVSLLLAISILCSVLLVLLFIRIREVDRTRQLKRHRSKGMGVADMLNYAAVVAPGVVIGKSGVLIAGWEYTAEDISSMEDSQRDSVSARINQALSRLGSGWTLHVDAVRRPIDPYAGQWSSFPDPVSQAIDDERRELLAGSAYATTFVLCVTYRPPAGAVKRLSEIIYHDNQKVDARADAANTLTHFERELTNIEHRLSSVVSLRRLMPRTKGGVMYDELLSHLQYCVTGIHQPIRLPRTPIYLDVLIGGQEMYGGVLPRIGRNYLQIIAIEGFPAESYSGILTALGELGLNYRWSTRFVFLESWEALENLDKFRKRWKTLTIPFLSQVFNFKTDHVNEDAMSMVVDATSASTAISGGMGWSGAFHG